VLLEAVKLYLEDKLEVYWGKVYIKEEINDRPKRTKTS
jgi:hypothetical protein